MNRFYWMALLALVATGTFWGCLWAYDMAIQIFAPNMIHSIPMMLIGIFTASIITIGETILIGRAINK